MSPVSSRAVFDAFLKASVENRWDDSADCYAEDVTIDMPFTLPGVPRVSHGREEMRRRFHRAGAVRRIVRAENVVVHETTDPEVLVAEFDLHQEDLRDGHDDQGRPDHVLPRLLRHRRRGGAVQGVVAC
jgi:ketosteroid isomerase-like protein